MKVNMSSIHIIWRQPWRNIGIACLIGCSAFGIHAQDVSQGASTVQTELPAVRGPIIRTVAGGRTPTGDARSSIYGTSSVAVRGKNIYLSDFNTSSIYRLGPTGDVTRVAGSGAAGFAGDGGLATHALLGPSLRLGLDDSGNLFFADADNNRIRRVDAASGIITTVAGNGSAISSGDQGPARLATVNLPAGVAWHAGNLFIVEERGCAIRKVDANGIITTVAGVPNNCGFNGDGGPAHSALLNTPISVTFDRGGNLLITDSANNRIRRVDAATGVITTVVGNGAPGFLGDGGPATAAQLTGPDDVAVDKEGDLYI